ncbi:hypothetical protein [Rhodospira trueperi]|uniref:hypothetical protein n=1 Tax=Rhodospira trueperi TaxID=69960 RepID=UPI00115FEB81|nr:hypothetical protein [Rhodospira trueperi]
MSSISLLIGINRRRLVMAGALALAAPGLALAATDPRPPGSKPAPPSRPTGAFKRFAPETWGYRFDLPGDWIVATPAPYTVVVSGPEGTDAYYTPVAVRNLRAPEAETPADAARLLMQAYRRDLEARHESFLMLRETMFRPGAGATDGGRADLPRGRQMVAEWTGADGIMRQWAVARPRPRAAVVHLWTYTAEDSLFDVYLPTARLILESWSLAGVESGG